jgi:hypothetical protein
LKLGFVELLGKSLLFVFVKTKIHQQIQFVKSFINLFSFLAKKNSQP